MMCAIRSSAECGIFGLNTGKRKYIFGK